MPARAAPVLSINRPSLARSAIRAPMDSRRWDPDGLGADGSRGRRACTLTAAMDGRHTGPGRAPRPGGGGRAGRAPEIPETGEPGPVWRDFSVSFAQPDTDDPHSLNVFPAAFMAAGTPRFEIEHAGCYRASVCLDMQGNSGGASIEDMQLSAFQQGILIDGGAFPGAF